MVVNVPLSCSENLEPLLQTRKPSRTSTGGFQSPAFRRFCLHFFFLQQVLFLANRHPHLQPTTSTRLSQEFALYGGVGGDSSCRTDVHFLPVLKSQVAQKMQVHFCRSGFLSFNLCGKPKTRCSFFSLEALWGSDEFSY